MSHDHAENLPDSDVDELDLDWDARQDEARREAEERGRCVYDCGACWRCR